MLKLSLKHPRYGYRRVTILLREDSWLVNFKRVYRLWCQEGLKVPKKQHKRLYTGTSANSCDKKRSQYYNHVWSYDFLTERLENGKRVRLLVVIDTPSFVGSPKVKSAFAFPPTGQMLHGACGGQRRSIQHDSHSVGKST